MDDRQKAILDAALDVFSRYGVKKATMNDIAVEAGVARQTLYNAFTNKDAIIVGLIESYVEQTVVDIENLKDTGPNPAQCLEVIFDSLARKPFEILRNTPHGAEIMEGITETAKDRVNEGNRKFSKTIAALLETQLPKNSAFTSTELGDYLVHATIGLKHKAEDREHMESLLRTLKLTMLPVLDETT